MFTFQKLSNRRYFKIDVDKVARKSNLHNFDDRNIAAREYWNQERIRETKKLAAKEAIGAASIGVNEVCPTYGELVTGIGQGIGSVGEFAGRFTENEKLEEWSEVMNSGIAIGSSLNNIRNVSKGKEKLNHIKGCDRCDESKENYFKNVKNIGAFANSLVVAKETLEPFIKRD